MQKPKRPLMHTNIHGSSWINRSAGPMSLEDWARASEYFFLTLKEKCAGTPKTWSLLPKQISYVAHLKLNPSLGMQRYKDMTRYDKICRGLSLFVSRWLAFRRFQQHLLWRQRQQEIDDVGLVLWESNRENVRENGEITVAQCLVDPRWPKKWHWCMDVAKHY